MGIVMLIPILNNMIILDKKLIDSLVNPVADKWDIDPSWLKAIISTESSWDTCAIRYEPNYVYLYNTETCAKVCRVTLGTEIATQKMSWGLCQIMGALAREQGFVKMLPELIDPKVNIYQLAVRIDHLRGIKNDQNWIFAAYNAGPGVKEMDGKYPNQQYVDKVNGFLSV